MAIIFSILFVVAIVVCIRAYFVGKFNGERESAKTVLTVAQTMNEIIEKTLKHSEYQTVLWGKVLEQKDFLITSLSKENTELRQALDDVNNLETVLSDDEETDEEDEDKVPVPTVASEMSIAHMLEHKTAAHVAIDLHSKIEAAINVIPSLNMSKEQSRLLTDILSVEKSSNVNNN